jgi:hypothetical protein
MAAARRLDQDIDLDADVLGLLLGHESVGVVGGDHGAAEQAAVGDANQGLLEGRLLAQQGDELLGHALARQRPQALAGASDEDDGRDERHGCSLGCWGASGRRTPRDGPRYSRR